VQRLAEERTRAQRTREPGEVLRGALSDVEDLTGVVVEVAAELGEPISLPERVQPLSDGDVERPRRARRPREQLLAVVDGHLATAEPGVELGSRERSDVDRWRGEPDAHAAADRAGTRPDHDTACQARRDAFWAPQTVHRLPRPCARWLTASGCASTASGCASTAAEDLAGQKESGQPDAELPAVTRFSGADTQT
jgi:hypothetical protein